MLETRERTRRTRTPLRRTSPTRRPPRRPLRRPPRTPRPPRQPTHYGRYLLILLCIIGIIYGVYKGWKYYEAYKATKPAAAPVATAQQVPQKSREEQAQESGERFDRRINILLLGIDDGDSEAAASEPKRTDAMMLASINPVENSVAILSLPRDTLVNIPNYSDGDKIGHAYAYGGVQLCKETVATLLQLNIDYYILANWQGFIKVVDILGGVDLYIEQDMDYEDPYANLAIHLKQGYQHLDGKAAGHYVRFRHDELGDIGRVQRQQKFMRAMAGELFNITNLMKLPLIMDTVAKHIQTDMDALTLIRAANSFKFSGSQGVRSEMLYGHFKEQEGISYWGTNAAKVSRTLDELKIPHGKIGK